MSNALVRSAQKSLEVKSLKDLVRARSNENPVLLIDVSISMGDHMRNGKRRIDGLRLAVTDILAKRPTQLIAFGLNREPNPEAAFLTGIQPNVNPMSQRVEVDFVTEVPEPEGGTPMAEGIDFARQNGFGRAVVISDGAPNDRSRALEAARQFGGRIDVMYVGDPGDPGSIFLEELAKLAGGQRFEGDLSEVKEIAGAVVGLLAGETMEEDEDDDDEDDDEDGDDDDEDDDDVEDAEEFEG